MRKLSIGDKFIPYCVKEECFLTLQSKTKPDYNEKNTCHNSNHKYKYNSNGTKFKTCRSNTL